MNEEREIHHLFSIDDLSVQEIEALLSQAEKLKKGEPRCPALLGKVAGLMFLQPSTRTRIGFHVAMQRLGGLAVEIFESKYQPDMDTAESFEDTIRVVSCYCDVVVLRHSVTDNVLRALEVSSTPIINAGSGQEYHPTQAIIDLFAIRRHFGRIDGLRVGLAGDLSHSRSARSLVRALKHYPPSEFRLMAPEGRNLPQESIDSFPERIIKRCDCLDVERLDVLYMAGMPSGGRKTAMPEDERAGFQLTPEKLTALPQKSIVLCPLPRIDEIDRAVDNSPQAAYFVQSADGLFVRMAILQFILGQGHLGAVT